LVDMDSSHTYQQRQSLPNDAEVKFEKWCEAHGWKFYRVGFDEKDSNVPMFYNLNPILRNMPDYLLVGRQAIRVMNVKGTDCIKRKEYELLSRLMQSYSSFAAPLKYAFFYGENEPIIKDAKEVQELYEQKEDRKWNDGVIYRKLELWEN